MGRFPDTTSTDTCSVNGFGRLWPTAERSVKCDAICAGPGCKMAVDVATLSDGIFMPGWSDDGSRPRSDPVGGVIGWERARMDAAHSALTTTDVGEGARPRDLSPHSAAPRPRLVGLADKSRPRSHGSRYAKSAVVAADAVAIATAMGIAAWIRWMASSTPEALGPLWLTAAIAIPVWLGVFARYKLYSAAAVTSVTAEVSRILHAVAAASACTGFVALVLAAPISRVWLLLTFATSLFTVVIERSIVRRVFRKARSRGQLQRRVVIIGTNAEALGVVQMLRAQPRPRLPGRRIALLRHAQRNRHSRAGAR